MIPITYLKKKKNIYIYIYIYIYVYVYMGEEGERGKDRKANVLK